MPRLLHLMASPRGEASERRRAARRLAQGWLQAEADWQSLERDLSAPALPHPDAPFAEASLLPEALREPRHRAALALSESLIAELDSADAILLSTPVHNFMVPSTLKAWIDWVLRPRRTFLISPSGKTGLLRNRPVRIVLSCGGALDPSPGEQAELITPYLRQIFATLGLHDVQFQVWQNRNRSRADTGQDGPAGLSGPSD